MNRSEKRGAAWLAAYLLLMILATCYALRWYPASLPQVKTAPVMTGMLKSSCVFQVCQATEKDGVTTLDVLCDALPDYVTCVPCQFSEGLGQWKYCGMEERENGLHFFFEHAGPQPRIPSQLRVDIESEYGCIAPASAFLQEGLWLLRSETSPFGDTLYRVFRLSSVSATDGVRVKLPAEADIFDRVIIAADRMLQDGGYVIPDISRQSSSGSMLL